ncbi:MAG: CRISPR-associated protein Csx11 [Methanothrix sp.]|uniref:CRISPR-associated protein Csx11 n=1 Tax=Methanothrix sp. TaxID=90426 RepID=UPI0025F0A04D|nr:CRISPR-associated protein Csx11 [Methanothrix sp.]MBK7387441.1 CRISPR-associated protein Csx11 [Methanothrix sp.]
MNDLDRLSQCRQGLLLAELAAWLHDMGKCSDEHIINQSSNKPAEYSFNNKRDYSYLLDSAPTLSILGESITIKELVEEARPRVVDDINKSWLLRALGRCHGAAHVEKEEAEKTGKQLQNDTRLSNVFGFEQTHLSDLSNRLKSLPFSYLTDRALFLPAAEFAFSKAPGETRRPENEITLWDWSSMVAALYKSAVSGALIGFKPDPADLNWRLLSIRFDGFSFFVQNSRLPDLLSRIKLLSQILDEIRQLLEIGYTLGTEVYRDENGSIFVVPGCDKSNCTFDLLTLQGRGKKLIDQILDKSFSVVEGELVPEINIDSKPWWGQDPLHMKKKRQGVRPDDELPPVSNHLKRAISCPKPDWVRSQWAIQEEICTVCGLRPQGPSEKSKERYVCDVCEQRRTDRSKEWATEKLNTTIWIDEVADINGRLALIVGNFDLSKWLSGDLVLTLTVSNPANAQNKTADQVSKNPSFARLRRIWETTQGFWLDVYPTDKAENIQESLVNETVGMAGARLEIRGTIRQRNGTYTPGPYHAYDLVLPKGIKLSVSWDPETDRSTEPKGRFISIDNLIYLVSLAGDKAPPRDKDEREEDYSMRLHRWAVEGLKELIQGTLTIEEATGYGGKAKEWGEIEVDCINIIPNSQYTPAIPILAEPRTFMALVPADKALKTVEEIKAKYEREMGKVRNRLPLHLCIVYAHRRTPLRAILDAGRRMLKQSARPDGWKVVCAARKLADRGDTLPERFSADRAGQFKEWLEILLERDGRKANWLVPAMMGDGQTLDQWYPYVFINGSEPVDRDRRFKAPNPWTGSDGWLVHVADLKTDDLVYFNPATLDFQWLDSAGRRFEISYDGGQRRNLSRRPYLLEELETLEHIWKTLKDHLSKNQIYILRDLIEAKREDWKVKTANPVREDVFWRFCRNALANAQWTKGKKDRREDRLPWESEEKDRKDWLDQWADYAVRGWITDAIEIYLQIMKEEV